MKKPVKRPRGRPPSVTKRKAGRPRKTVVKAKLPSDDWRNVVAASSDKLMAVSNGINELLDRSLRRTALDYATKSVPAVGDSFIDHATRIYDFLKGESPKVEISPVAEEELLAALRPEEKRDDVQDEPAAGEVATRAQGDDHGE